MVVFVSTNFSFAGTCVPACTRNQTCECDSAGVEEPEICVCVADTASTNADVLMKACRDAWWSAAYDFVSNTCTCTKNNKEYSCESVPSWTEETTGNTATETSTSSMGISCNPDQLVNGQCKMNIYDTLGIRKSVRNSGDATSVGLFVQDIVLSATFFIGTLVTVALIVSGIMFIFAASSGKDPANAKKWMVGSLVGLLVVVSSYVIIRLVQYIAKGF